jgi:TP901 family phage tail tape measure protein
LEIRAKISLAVEQFKTNAAVVGSVFKGMTTDSKNYSKNVDNYIAKNLSNRINASNAGKIHDMRNLHDFEKEMHRSSRRMAKEALNAQMRGGQRQEVTIQPYKPKSLYRQEEIAAQRAMDARVDATRKLYRQEELIAQQRMDRFAANAKKEIGYAKYIAVEKSKEFMKNSWFEIKQGKANLDWKIAHARRAMEYGRQMSDISRLQAKREFDWKVAYARKDLENFKKNAAYQIAVVKYNTQQKIGEFKREIDYRVLFNQQTKQAHAANGGFNESLNATRYALYDVGSKFLAFGTGIATALGAAVMKSAEFESAFTRVERTSGATGAELDGLKKSLMEIARTSPVSYEDITKVATLGAQMGIAADSLDEFTNTVSNFSSITGVSVEETAQAFGRLGQLLDVPASKFENLSSAITYVGVNAVATDREILNMSESIAAASNQAGFAADEVIGLSGALASLKVRPEEARGVIVRLFREIDSSVSEGGTRLADFAKLIGKTSEQASALWQQDPSHFFQSFLVGAKASGDLNGAITALGITNSRELNVIQRLANNTDVLASTMRDAREQYLLATYAGDAYGKVQDDLQSKFKMLQNVIDQLSASFGDSLMGPLKVFVDMLIKAGEVLLGIPGPVKFVITLLAAIASGVLLFKGSMLLAIGGMLAMKQALAGMAGESIRSAATLGGLHRAMLATGLITKKSTFSLVLFNKTLISTTASARVATIASRALAGSMILLQKAFLPLMLLGTVATVIASIVESNNAASDSTNKLGNSMVEAGGGIEEFRNAMAKDTAIYNKTGEALGTLNFMYDESIKAKMEEKNALLAVAVVQDSVITGLEGSEVATGKLTNAKGQDAKMQRELNDLVQVGTELTQEQTLALGANTAAFVAKALASYGEEGKNFYEEFVGNQDKAAWEAAGFDIAEMIAAGLSEEGGATKYIDKIQDDIYELRTDVINARTANPWNADEAQLTAIQEWGAANNKTAEEILALNEAFKTNKALVSDTNAMDGAAESVDAFRASAEAAAAASEIQIQVLIDQGFSPEEAADQVGGLSEKLKNYLNTSFSIVNASGNLYSSFQQLSNGIKETDGNFDVFTEDGRKNMANFQSFAEASLAAATAAGTGFAGGLEKIAAGLIVLEDGGYDTAAAFDVMKNYISAAAAGEQYSDLANNIKNATDPSQLNAIINAWILTKDSTTEAGIAAIDYGNKLKAALTGGGYAKTFLMQWEATRKETAKTATTVKTILQYASELGRVLKESIDIKFSRTSGLIQLKNTIADINNGIKEARANIASLEASVAEKMVTRAQLVIDLKNASQFGDVAEVSRIRAEIATIDGEIASAQEDISYNTGISTGSLDLNTQAGRDNLTTINGLTTSYADYIESLVKSGASTATVNREIAKSKTAFENQLKAMGLSTTQITEYSDAFDGFSTIVENVPSDVTVQADTDPAVTALNNFLAQVNASEATVDVALNYPTKDERLAALKAEKTRLQTEYNTLKKANSPLAQGRMSEIQAQINSIDNDIELGMYAQGGLIQGFGGNTQDNIPIMASRGEFMMSAGSVSRYGADFMNALNQQRVGMSGFGGGMSAAGNSSGGVVYLSARDRELLQAAINRPVTLKTSNRIIAQSANDGNKELARNGAN